MKLNKKISYQCAAIVQPGELLINRWDNRQCLENNLYLMLKCEQCGNLYCHMLHWPKHRCTGVDDNDAKSTGVPVLD